MDSSWVVFSHPLVEKRNHPHSPPKSPLLNSNKWSQSVYISLHHPPSLFSTSCHQPLLDSESALWMENLAYFFSPKTWSHYCFGLKEFRLWYQPLPTTSNSHPAHLTRPSTWNSHVTSTWYKQYSTHQQNHHKGRKTRLHRHSIPRLSKSLGRIHVSPLLSRNFAKDSKHWPCIKLFCPTKQDTCQLLWQLF